MEKYTIVELKKEFPNDDVCLDYIFRAKYPDTKQYYRVAKRKCYAHSMTAHQIHPLAGTIFENSKTPLTAWFHAMFLFASSKNGVSAKELQRQLGVTYKCAWRMAHQIRKLMEQGSNPLTGEVEVDETFYGKKGSSRDRHKNKQALVGMVERKGSIRVKTLPNRRAENVLPTVKAHVARGAHIITDEYSAYNRLTGSTYGFRHSSVKHGKNHFAWKGQNTNTIEGFWGQFKRSVRGTYHFVSAKHLSSYVDEFAFRYNQRLSPVPIFRTLVSRAAVQ